MNIDQYIERSSKQKQDDENQRKMQRYRPITTQRNLLIRSFNYARQQSIDNPQQQKIVQQSINQMPQQQSINQMPMEVSVKKTYNEYFMYRAQSEQQNKRHFKNKLAAQVSSQTGNTFQSTQQQTTLLKPLSHTPTVQLQFDNTVPLELENCQLKTQYNYKDSDNEMFLQLVTCKLQDKLLNKYPVLNENQIQQQYSLKLPIMVSQYENQNSDIHFLQSFDLGMNLINSYIAQSQANKKILIDQKTEIKQQMEKMKQDHEEQMQMIMQNAQNEVKKIEYNLRIDFIKQQNEMFALNKELTILQRDKIVIEVDILKARDKLNGVESKMMGCQAFDLQTDDPQLLAISKQNWRVDEQQFFMGQDTMKNLKKVLN